MTLLQLYALAEFDEIEVDEFNLSRRESFSIMDEDGKCAIAINPLCLRSIAEEKVKLAHEMGHCELGAFYNRWAACDVRRRHEVRADKWAIEHLVPERELRAAVRAGYTTAWELAEYFGVTEEFLRKAVHWYRWGNIGEE